MSNLYEVERRVRQINEDYNRLIQQEREAEMEGKRLLKEREAEIEAKGLIETHEWTYDMNLATEVARAGAEVARLERIRNGKVEEVWKEWKDSFERNNPRWSE